MTAHQGRRILMTADAVGGVWVYATGLARALCDNGYQVTLVVMGPRPSGAQLNELGSISGLRLALCNLPLEWMDPEGARLFTAREMLLRIADQSKPNLIHLNSYREAVFDWPAPRLVVAHSCVWSWWKACHGTVPDQPRWHTYMAAVGAGLAAADAWIAPTQAFRDTMASLYRPPTPGNVIWNGIETSYSARTKQSCILAAGRMWDHGKNLATLAQAAPRLDWPIRVAGSVSDPDGVNRAITPERVIYLGTLTHSALLAAMDSAAIFTAPSLYEPFGLSVLEAAARGCALVLSDIETFRELWGDAALFVDPRDPRALEHALQELSRNDGLRTALQRAARIRSRRYCRAQMLSGYRAAYSGITRAIVPQSRDLAVSSQEWLG